MIIYFVRHGQSMGNMTNDYSTDAHDQLSPLGWEQAERLKKRLNEYRFDAIYVSPIKRAMQTIKPYLQKSGKIAELWPEVAEACWQEERDQESPQRQGGPERIVVEDELKGYFVVRDDAPFMPWRDETFREGEARLLAGKEELLRRHAGGEDRVLVVAHGYSGCILLELLLGLIPDRVMEHDNTGISCLVEQDSGRFKIAFINRSA